MANNIDRPNIADDEYKRDIVRRIEAVLSEKESEKGKYLKLCQGLNAQVDDLLEEAKAKGLPKKSLKGIIKLRELDKKADALRDALEDDQRQVLISIEEALGSYIDTPLGAAAAGVNKATVGTAGPTTLEKGPGRGRGSKPADEAPKQDATTSAVVDAVRRSQSADEAQTGEAEPQDEATKEAERRRMEEQRAADAASFDNAPPAAATKADATATAGNVTQLDPAAARRNRSGSRTKADQASDAMKSAEAKSDERAKAPTDQLKQTGAEPGKMKF